MAEAAVLLLIVAIRGLTPLLLFRWPFVGALLCIAADASDSILQDALGIEPLDDYYHNFDKAFDIYYLALEAVVAWRWTDPLARWTALALFALRLGAVAAFELTDARGTFLAGPNVFENFYLFVAGARSIDPAFRITGLRQLVLIVLFVGIPKVLQEYVMHYREAQTWHFVRDEVLLFWR